MNKEDCLGHITKPKKNCYIKSSENDCCNCVADEFNKHCENYKPIKLFIIEVKNGGNKK